MSVPLVNLSPGISFFPLLLLLLCLFPSLIHSIHLSLLLSISTSLPLSINLSFPLSTNSLCSSLINCLHECSIFHRRLVSVDINSGMAMQSAAKCPFLLSFKTEPWDGPNENFKSHNTQLDDFTHLHTSSG